MSENKSNKTKYNQTKKNRNPIPLKTRMLAYYKNKTVPDLCCEKDYKREVLIGQLFTLYEAMAKMSFNLGDELGYLDSLYNDLFFFLSPENVREDNQSETISKILTKHMIKKDKNGVEQISKNGIIFVLMNVPLYYLLAFLGRAYSTYKRMKDMMEVEFKPYTR